MSTWQHVRAIGLLPGVVTVVVPAVIVLTGDAVQVGWGLPEGVAALAVLAGVGLIGLGLLLVVRTVALFASIGGGPPAPRGPTPPALRGGAPPPRRHPADNRGARLLPGGAPAPRPALLPVL